MTIKNTSLLLIQLRGLMKNTSYVPQAVSAYIVPSGDAHLSEYIAPCDERRAFVSGFTGSYGTVVITQKSAALWTDGRYYLQASQQMDDNWTLMKYGLPETPNEAKWLSENLPVNSVIGVDPYLIEYKKWSNLSKELKSYGHTLIPIPMNLVDIAWGCDRPARPANFVVPLQVKYTGMTSSEKIEKIREKLIAEQASSLVVTALDEVAYLFNLRGSDIDFNPVFYSYAVVTLNDAHLFIDDSQISAEARDDLTSGNSVVILHPYESLPKFIENLAEEDSGKIWISDDSSYAITSLVNEDKRVAKISPIALMKAVKNETEIKGMESCHIRDASAMCRYINWLEKQIASSAMQTEISAADQLQKFREEQDDFVGLSFTTISSVGPNAAIIHYSPSPETDRQITDSEIYLVDSGGQYKDGTTDITRTLHFGIPSDYEKECFTRVLKGVISLATSKFPEKIKGNCLDSFARKSLWDVGLDYKHGTGHGVGMFLNVHEGPMGISWRNMPSDPGLQEGMFLSDEPGYYEDGKFGIRIENIVRALKVKTKYNGGRDFLTFKTVTLVPIQTKLMDLSLLTKQEVDWLNDYHQECLEKVGGVLLKQGHREEYNWLVKATLPIG